MRQRRWLELINDYDLDIVYHEGKANKVADALSRKSSHTLQVLILADELCKDFHKLNLEVVEHGYVEARLNVVYVEPNLFKEIQTKQSTDDWLIKLRKMKEEGQAPEFEVNAKGIAKYKGRWCVPNNETLKDKILKEAHNSHYSIHHGGDKLYKDLKQHFWWPRMKREVAEFVAKCLNLPKG
ncbi:uncharacterized protein LOC130590491 [Beta vulgaris subsp. vulgaris]|uniref:uncharacterized protein LOC130590491 n=1 Tax=Beta vulgaris subsp. vulgaris TaxID=3555 RepID=UPI00254897DC|nr:uncharacterized protein LOC130590491 [Beta vulgaris subsp. vulgaris]